MPKIPDYQANDDDEGDDLTILPFKKDARGRYIVPDDYDPPSGFRGRTITRGGVELGYPGLMRRRRKPTIADGE
jgi:hypothetical protein